MRMGRKSTEANKRKHNSEAKASGVKIIGPGKHSSWRTYRLLDCGHEQEMQLSQVRSGVKCWTCVKAKHKQEAKAAGLTLIGPGKDARSYPLEMLDTLMGELDPS